MNQYPYNKIQYLLVGMQPQLIFVEFVFTNDLRYFYSTLFLIIIQQRGSVRTYPILANRIVKMIGNGNQKVSVNVIQLLEVLPQHAIFNNSILLIFTFVQIFVR